MSECNECGAQLIEDQSMRHHIPGGKEGSTTYTYYECGGCGQLWTNIRDHGGLGGHGSFWHNGHIDDSGKEITG